MSTDFGWGCPMSRKEVIAVMRNEEDELLRSLWRSSEFARFRAIRYTLISHGEEPRDPFRDDAIPPMPEVTVPKTKSKTARIITEAKGILAHHNTYMSTTELRQSLELLGITIGGQDPNSNLASHLSQSGQFINERGKGWKLKTYDAPDDESEAPSSKAPSSNGQDAESTPR